MTVRLQHLTRTSDSVSLDALVTTATVDASRLEHTHHSVLPALTDFHYRYLEDFLAQINTPQLDDFRIECFVRLIRAPQLTHFVDRREGLKLHQLKRTKVTFYPLALCV